MEWQLITYKNVQFSKNGQPISDPYFYHCVQVTAMFIRTYVYCIHTYVHTMYTYVNRFAYNMMCHIYVLIMHIHVRILYAGAH